LDTVANELEEHCRAVKKKVLVRRPGRPPGGLRPPQHDTHERADRTALPCEDCHKECERVV
jgi:hypothetical protein